EVEFLYAQSPHFVKGFIDLLFCHRGIWYFLDWKSNWLGNSDADYNLLSLEKAMQSSDYGLQAALYAEALQRRMGSAFETNFGGAFYLFLRGCKALYIDPDRRGIHARFI